MEYYSAIKKNEQFMNLNKLCWVKEDTLKKEYIAYDSIDKIF